MNRTKVKLAFLGDITCDRPMLKAAKKNGSYDFVHSLEGIREVVSDCDIVIGNLETVFAGPEKGYNPFPISYNSPDELCAGIKAAGITLVTTANNHCLDMGGSGVVRTAEVLNKNGIDHTGTYSASFDGQRYIVKHVNGIRIAFVSMTAVMNLRADGSCHSLQEWNQVNIIKAYNASQGGSSAKRLLKKVLPMKTIKQFKAAVKRAAGIALVTPKVDNEPITERDIAQIEKIIEILKEAKSNSDFVVACVHSGGQFNYEPGTYSTTLYDMLEPYCDAIIGNHPHVIQRMERRGGKIRAYSLGSVNMSPSADYISHETDSDYSAVIKVELKRDKDKVEIADLQTGLLHAAETADHYVVVRPVQDSGAAYASMKRLESVH